MEAINAASLTPLSVFSERRTEATKSLQQSLNLSKSPSSISIKAPTIQDHFSRTLHGGLVFMSSVLASGLAKALTFEEALKQSVSFPTSDSGPNEILESLISFGTDNPVIVGGGVAALAVPLVFSQILKKPKPWGVESAKNAYAKLSDEGTAQLLDIRAPADIRQVGSPDIRGLGKKPVSIAYKGEDKPGFLKKLSSKFKEPENTTLFILDKFDGNSELVAELVTLNGFKASYAIKDGAEGWMSSGLPWIPPRKALIDLSNLTDAIGGTLDGSDGLPAALGVAAAAGLGLLAFTEIETLLQVLGAAALVQFVSTKFLFAKDRKATLQQLDEYVNNNVAPKELVDDIKQIGKALLPAPIINNALPAPAEAAPEPTAETKVEAAADPTPQINSVSKTEVEEKSLPGLSRPLSPYPAYPDLKPPTSPSPSQP